MVLKRRSIKDDFPKKKREKRELSPKRDIDLIKELSGEGMTVQDAISKLKQMGFVR